MVIDSICDIDSAKAPFGTWSVDTAASMVRCQQGCYLGEKIQSCFQHRDIVGWNVTVGSTVGLLYPTCTLGSMFIAGI